MQSAVSAADQDRIIGASAGGRQAIASKAVSTGVKSISCVPSSLILSSSSGIEDEGVLFEEGRDFDFSLILVVGKVIQCQFVDMEDRALRDSDP